MCGGNISSISFTVKLTTDNQIFSVYLQLFFDCIFFSL